jgi:serine/threonine-protein kinase
MARPEDLPDRYPVLQLLGEGDAGRVWLVEDRHRPAVRLALKQLVAADRARAESLRLEFATLTGLRHPGLVELHDLDVAPGGELPFFTMEYVQGEDLVTAVRREGAGLFLDLAAEALRALSFLHDFGFVHRDLKPGNLLVRRRPRLGCRLVVLDFGLAMRGELGEKLRTTVGTLPYIAPELFDRGPPGPATDLYALGAVLFEAIHGRPAFRPTGEDLARFVETVRAGRRTRPQVPEGFPADLGGWLEDLLSPDPSQRPAAASEALARLNDVCGTDYPAGTAADRAARLASGAPPGRETEIEKLGEHLAPSERPRLVWLCGTAGSGKKRLLRWLVCDAVAHGWEVVVSPPELGPESAALNEGAVAALVRGRPTPGRRRPPPGGGPASRAAAADRADRSGANAAPRRPRAVRCPRTPRDGRACHRWSLDLADQAVLAGTSLRGRPDDRRGADRGRRLGETGPEAFDDPLGECPARRPLCGRRATGRGAVRPAR